MKLLKITTAYPEYLKQFYSRQPGLEKKSFAEQKAALDYDGFGWADFWSQALAPLGYEVFEITANAGPAQREWARENGLPDAPETDIRKVALAQVKNFKPDILWFDDHDEELLKQIRAEVPRLSLVLGWVGSALPVTKVWRYIDLVLSCAPESVERLRLEGFRSEHLHHGFEPRINERIQNGQEQIDLSFIGQIVRGSQFHMQRERILEQLIDKMNVRIYSPSAGFTFRDDLKAFMRQGIYSGMQFIRALGVPGKTLARIPKIGKAALWTERPMRPVNPKLKPYMKPGVYGLDMFQVLRNSKMSLNIHADSSPLYASNMRLFEATGVGTCLVTDWKENITELFTPEKEVVTYKTAEECVEKVKWLLEHPAEREAIAKAGQVRALRDHTFTRRALRLDEIIRRELKAK